MHANVRSTTPRSGFRSGPRSNRNVAMSLANLALFQRQVISPRGAGIELARTADSHMRVGDHFLPMGNPTGGARDGEHDREHGTRNSESAVDDARIEIDVRVQLARYKVVVFESDFLELQRKFEQRVIALAHLFKHAVTHAADDLGTRVDIFVDAVTKAHQAHAARLVFDARQKLADVCRRADAAEHIEYGLVCAAVRGTPECRNPGGNCRVGIYPGASREPD